MATVLPIPRAIVLIPIPPIPIPMLLIVPILSTPIIPILMFVPILMLVPIAVLLISNLSFVDAQHSANSQLFLTFLYCLNDKFNFSHHWLIIMCFVMMSHFFKVDGRSRWFIVCKFLQSVASKYRLWTLTSSSFNHIHQNISYAWDSLCQHSRAELNYTLMSLPTFQRRAKLLTH